MWEASKNKKGNSWEKIRDGMSLSEYRILMKGKNMKSSKVICSIVMLAAMTLTGCTGGSSSVVSTSPASSPSVSSATSSSVSTSSGPDISKKVTLNMSVMYDNSKKPDTYMKFKTGSSVTLPYSSCDGTTYAAEDFKPVWKALQKNLNFTINDITEDGTSLSNAFTDYVTAGFKSKSADLNIAQGDSTAIISEGTTHDTILDLSQYLNQMPNYKKFLIDNPIVYKSIVDANGKMFYAPYFDGYDDIERMLMLRQDWVEKLLDGDLPTTLDATTAITNYYTPYTPENINTTITVLNDTETGTKTIVKNHAANIITTQNALSSKDGSSLVKALRDYIDATYGTSYGTKRSKLFCGGQATYDVDELVALYRCVKANPAFLTGDATKNIVPFFTRASTNDRTSDLYRLAAFFGARGGESRQGWLYVKPDGTLGDSRGSAEMRDSLKYMNAMYKEGLILQNFTTSGTVVAKNDDFRGGLLQQDRGFSTYDYNQTTTVYNDDATCKALNGGKFLFASVLPAVTKWGTNVNYGHYTESWRSVKPNGWFITKKTASDSDALNRCLALFDYLFSDTGNRLMSYGPDAYLAKNSDNTIKTMDYQGKSVAVLSDACKNELATKAAGNYTNYYRFYVGATYPVGYIKQQGMEYQTVSAKALPSLDDINKAIQYNVITHVNHLSTNTDHYLDIVPATLPFTAAEQTAISTGFTKLDSDFNNAKGKTNYFNNIIMNGFGTYDGLDLSYDNFVPTFETTLNMSGYLSYYNDAYTRFKALVVPTL
jgi:hypothetical protein